VILDDNVAVGVIVGGVDKDGVSAGGNSTASFNVLIVVDDSELALLNVDEKVAIEVKVDVEFENDTGIRAPSPAENQQAYLCKHV
jgi:hypothetical protein